MSEIVTVRNPDRFLAPRSTVPIVARSRLDRLYADATGQVLRVLAPGGYGKSTQIARWAETESRQLCWLDLERVDNDPFVLANALATALADPGGGATGRGAPFAEVAMTTLLREFRDLVRQTDGPYVLVLDDVHNVVADDSLALIDVVAQHLPADSTLVLSGRSHPGERSVSRHRLGPGVVDVSATDLALDLTETSEMLASMGIDLDLDALTDLTARFEGWPAGLRLAAMVLQSDGTAAWTSPARIGDTTLVLDYVRTEWTGQLPIEDLQFLGEIACLERFSGEMCDEVLGREASLVDLRRLHRNDLLVVPLDRRDEWFRMHPVLAGWLSGELKTNEVGRWREIHARASAWWAARGDIDLAVGHAVTSEDWAAAEDLVANHGGRYLSLGRFAAVGHWLEGFPADYVRSSGALGVVRSLAALAAGQPDRVLRWRRQVERLLDTQHAAPDDPVRRRAVVLRMLVSPEAAAGLAELAASALVEDASDSWEAWRLHALGGARFLLGDPRAEETFAAAAFVAELNEMTVHKANAIGMAAIVAELDGDRGRAAEGARRAHALLTASPNGASVPSAHVDAVYALTEARVGNRDIAAREIERATRKLRGLEGIAPWYNVLARLALVRAALLIDDRTTTRTLVQEIEHDLRFEPEVNPVTPLVDALRESVDAAQLLPTDPASALTDAELRVLQFLPTNLTLSDIATRLFVSRNTVKSHVAAIYRKLDTTSRTETVDCARRAGILDEGSERRDP